MNRTSSKAQELYLKRRRTAMASAANIGQCLAGHHLTGVDLITVDLGRLAAAVLLDTDEELPSDLKWAAYFGNILREDLLERMDLARRERSAPKPDPFTPSH